jgi:hypothetical protein
MKLVLRFFYLLGSILLSGCAGVKLYKEETFKNQTGLKFYYPKPYLLVERNGAKDVPLKTTLLFLPDLTNPVYVKIIRGMGSNAFSLALANGALSTYGLTTDSKVPETIAAAGGLLTGAGGLLSGIAANKAGGDVEQAASVKDLQLVQPIVDKAKADLDNAITFPDFITVAQKDAWKATQTEIQNTKKLVDAMDPAPATIKKIIESLDKLTELLTQAQCKQETAACKNFNSRPASLVDQLNKAKGILQPKENTNMATFELYEIITDKGAMTYKLITPLLSK